MNDKLWQQVAAFELDDGQSALSFTQRLARENGWSLSFARRVIEEYRRFIYLAVRAGHPVTPSDEVDQVWHLHLVYTRSYWEELCGKVLEKPLHHGPTKGGPSEGTKFHDWYERTLASYERIFGTRPPPEIWPGVETRFSARLKFQRVNVGDSWIVSKSKLKRAAMLTLGTVSTLTLTMACSKTDGGSPETIFFVVVVAMMLIAVVRTTRKPGNRPRDGSGGGCSTFSGCGGSSPSSSGHGHSAGGSSQGHSGCGSHHGGSGCGSDGGSSGCGSSGCGSSCGGGGCGGGGD